jgi:hypothetical protein
MKRMKGAARGPHVKESCRRAALLLGLALLDAPLLVGQDATPLSPDSNGGGIPFTLKCGRSPDVYMEILIGVRGGSGTWVDWVQGICTEVSNDGKWIGAETTTGVSGTTTGTGFTIRCPAGHAVSALGGRAGQWVNRLSVSCRPLSTGGTLTGSPVLAGETSGTEGERAFGPNECLSNQPAVALLGNSGRIPLGSSIVERIGLSCALPDIAKLIALTLNAPSVVAPNSLRATAAFSRIVPSGVSLRLSSAAPSIASVRTSVSVPQREASTTFEITTVASSGGCADIRATHAGIEKSARLVVHPPVTAGAAVSLIIPDQAVLVGGRLTLRVSTPSVRMGVVALSSSDPSIATVPASVTTAGMLHSADFPAIGVREGCAIITAAFQGTTSRRAILVR